MKRFLLIILLLVSYFCYGQVDYKIIVPENYSEVPLDEFIHEISTVNKLKFYYKTNWISTAKISIESDSIFIKELLEKITTTCSIDCYIGKSGNVYLFPKSDFVKQLPTFSPIKKQSAEISSSDLLSSYMISRNANSQTTIEVGKPGTINHSKSVKVTGYLYDEWTNNPLIGATIFLDNIGIGAATNTNGELVLNIKPGTYSAVFQCMGMQKVECQLKVYASGSFTLKMMLNVHTLDEILVKIETNNNSGARSGLESIDFQVMKEMPTLMGERDVMRTAQLLPGIVSVSEGSGGLNVRGGNADQNLFYIDKMPIYNNSHLFGFFSSLNSSIVDNFSIYKGQVPVNYGGRLSSIFDIKTRKARKSHFFSEGGISPISANLIIETPIIKKKLGMIVSGRTTYSDWILKQMKDPVIRNSNASFYDMTSSFDYDYNDKNNISLLGYFSNDSFNLNKITSYSYGNKGGVLEYNHLFTQNLKLSGFLIGSNYHFNTTDETSPTEAYQHKYSIDHYEIKTELNWIFKKGSSLKAGFSNIQYNLERGNINPYGSESLKMVVSLGNESAIEQALFLGEEIKIGSRLYLYGGLRYSFYHELGPKNVRIYKTGVEKSDLTVESEKIYGNNEKIVSYSNPEFRGAVDYKTSLKGSLKMSVTQMSQYLFMLSNTISIAPNDQWKLADTHIKPQKSIQYTIGYDQHFPSPKLLASVEIYYKNGKNIVEYKDGADFLSTPYVETNVLQGKQDAYGAEFMVRKEVGNLNGWISYTYSRSNLVVSGLNEWDKINDGNPYPSNYDKPNVINMVTNWKINRRYSISSNFVYNSGRPVTLPIGYYYLDSYPYVDYSSRNEYRLPDYFRCDLSLKIEGNLRKKKVVHSYWMLSVYNLTGRKNVNSVFFTSEERHLRGYQYSVIGVPIYTISWNWKLGNYANN